MSARPYDTWRVCGRPVDVLEPGKGCTCGEPRRRAPEREADPIEAKRR